MLPFLLNDFRSLSLEFSLLPSPPRPSGRCLRARSPSSESWVCQYNMPFRWVSGHVLIRRSRHSLLAPSCRGAIQSYSLSPESMARQQLHRINTEDSERVGKTHRRSLLLLPRNSSPAVISTPIKQCTKALHKHCSETSGRRELLEDVLPQARMKLE